jgi:hypothetical protein
LRAEHEMEGLARWPFLLAPQSADAIQASAESEAETLIRETLDVVLALVDALVERAAGKLTGTEVDSVIESAIAREHLNIEIERRAPLGSSLAKRG